VEDIRREEVARLESAERAAAMARARAERERAEAEAAARERERAAAAAAAAAVAAAEEAAAAERRRVEQERVTEQQRLAQEEQQQLQLQLQAQRANEQQQQQHGTMPHPPAAATPADTAAGDAGLPGDPVAAARQLVAEFERTQAFVLEHVGVDAAEGASIHHATGLVNCAPRNDFAKRDLRLELRKTVTRITGTLAQTRACALRLVEILAGAAAADAARPVAAVPNSAHGVYFLYACDLVVSLFAYRAGDLPLGRAEDALTLTFGLARVIAYVGMAVPPFRQRYLAHLYQAVPAVIPSAAPASPTGRAPPVSAEAASQMASLYAAVMTEAPGRNPHGIAHAWQLLARTLNAPPRLSSIRVLLALLRYCSFDLFAAYGEQYVKLLRVLHRAYLPLVANLRGAEEEQAMLTMVGTMLAPDGVTFGPGPLLTQLPNGRDLPVAETTEET
jgi:hypothetical protein